MPSPNGYFDCGASSVQSRQRLRSEVVYDINTPPWPGPGDPSQGGYHWVVNIGTAPAGPFGPARLTDFGSGCNPQPDNEVPLGGATSTIVSIADPTPGTGMLADTDYYVEWILLDDVNVERDRFVCGPIHTEAYPTFVCAGGATGQTTADVLLGATSGGVNIDSPCNVDSIIWEIATTPGGPYTATASQPVTSLSPSHSFTGLDPDTTYYWRARLSEMAQTGGEYLVTQECSFTTDAAPLNPACDATGPFTSASGTVEGTADAVPTDHTMLLALGTTAGGPYPTTSPAAAGTNTAGQSVTHTFTGLAPSTTYYFRTEVRDPGNAFVEASAECSFTTAAAPQPPGPVPFQPIPCGAEAGAGEQSDVEGTLVCDVDAEGNVVGVALVEAVYDDAGMRTGTRLVNVTDGTDYVPQGTVQPCQEGCCPEPVILCDIQEDGTSTQFLRAYTGQADGGVEVTDQLLDGSVYVPTGTVGSCDPYSTCTPTSDQDLNGQCGPGETPSQTLIAEDPAHPLANSVFVDDASADALCGGSWDRPASPLVAPFPVNESFRNAAFDQPGPVLQGTAPYPDLTADTDGAGAGWLQVSDINGGTNGLWQVPSPFPTSQGMNASITWASHDGTTPGGDGMAFVFTDGSVPPQSIPVGGFGNLGLQNWQGGYVAVVVDEYGQTCTCSQAAQGTIDANPGPCGFCTNTISIQLAGSLRTGASCGCCTIASASLNPKALNTTTRFSPARVLVSIIEEGGQTYVSASIDWNDGNGPVQYFDRVNVTACAGPPPATLRMASYGGSGGAYRAIKEFRDATARPAGVSNWRAFPLTTDEIPACTTLVNIRACVDVTFNNDTQTQGNSNPEAYLLLVDTQTNTVLDRSVQSSIPAQVGNPNELCVEQAVTPDRVPFLRVYVGAESRDDNGEYDQLWENLVITATGTGCPAEQRRTLEISARCPIPVTIVGGGGGDGGGGGTTVVNTPATFEDAPVCMTVAGITQPGFRREVRTPDGAVEVSFLAVDGLPATPETWEPGGCAARDTEIVELCDVQAPGVVIPFLRVFTYDENGEVTQVENQDADGNVYTPTGVVTTCSVVTMEPQVLCDEGNGGQPFLRHYIRAGGTFVSVQDTELDGQALYAPVGPVGACAAATADADREVVCWTQTSTGTQVHTGTIRHDDTLPPPGWILFDQHQTPVLPGEPGLTFVPCGGGGECQGCETIELCDSAPACAPGTAAADRDWSPRYLTAGDFANPGVVAQRIDVPGGGAGFWGGGSTLFPNNAADPDGGNDGVHYGIAAALSAPACPDCFDPADTVTITASGSATNNGPGAGFLTNGRWRILRDGGEANGAVPQLAMVTDANRPAGSTWNFTATATVPWADVLAGRIVLTLDLETRSNGAYKSWTASGFDVCVVNDSPRPGCGTHFFRTLCRDCNGAIVSTADSSDGTTPYAPVGAVGPCQACPTAVPAAEDECCPEQLGSGCWDNAGETRRWTSFRNPDGSVTVVDTVTGNDVPAASIVPCSVAQQVTDHFVELVTAESFNIPTTGLRAWSVRCIAETVTLVVGSDPPVNLVAGEVVSASAPDSETTLSEQVTINVGAQATAKAHVIYQVTA